MDAMSEFLTIIGTFFTQAMTWLVDMLDIIAANPGLTVMILAMPIVGFVVGLFSRLLRA